MSGSVLLDTNIVIPLLNGEPAVASRLASVNAFVPLPVVGELEYGARNSVKAAENLAKIQQFVAGSSILLPDVGTAGWYGRLRHGLRLKGRPLPENDVWIAAIAMQYGLTLISRDAHFEEVDALSLERW